MIAWHQLWPSPAPPWSSPPSTPPASALAPRSSACPSPRASRCLVFFGAFIPVVGAAISGTVAVLLALSRARTGASAHHARHRHRGAADGGPPAAAPARRAGDAHPPPRRHPRDRGGRHPGRHHRRSHRGSDRGRAQCRRPPPARRARERGRRSARQGQDTPRRFSSRARRPRPRSRRPTSRSAPRPPPTRRPGAPTDNRPAPCADGRSNGIRDAVPSHRSCVNPGAHGRVERGCPSVGAPSAARRVRSTGGNTHISRRTGVLRVACSRPPLTGSARCGRAQAPATRRWS